MSRLVSGSISVVRVQYDSVRRLWLSPTISRSSRYDWSTNTGPSRRRISRARNNPSAGPRTGNPRPDLFASTLIISIGTISRPHGDDVAPSAVYHGLGSVIFASLSSRVNG